MTRYWLSCRAMTVRVDVDGLERIVSTAPICSTFVGQPLANLVRWMLGIGGFDMVELESE